MGDEKTYGAAGNVLTETTGNGKRTLAHTYDAAGRVTTTKLRAGPVVLRETTFEYDAWERDPGGGE